MSGSLPQRSVWAPAAFTRRATIVLLLAAAATTALFALHLTPYAIDDAWITYRYAENLGSGQGFVYNPGERVLGTSTPLYTLLLAGLHAAGLGVPTASYTIGYAAAIGTLVGVFLLTERLHSELAGLLAVTVVVLSPYFHRVMTYGMETPFYVCLIVFAFHAWACGRRLLGAALAALCLLTRLDGAAVGAALFAAYVMEHRRIPWKPVVLYAAIVAPWLAFATMYFGSPVPHSFVAKRQHMANPLQGWLLRWLLARAYSWPAAVGALAMLVGPGSRFVVLPFAMWSGAYITAYTFSSLWRHEWYFMPLTVPLGIFGAIGIVMVAERFFSRGAIGISSKAPATRRHSGCAPTCLLTRSSPRAASVFPGISRRITSWIRPGWSAPRWSGRWAWTSFWKPRSPAISPSMCC
jgi:hypothetical protein